MSNKKKPVVPKLTVDDIAKDKDFDVNPEALLLALQEDGLKLNKITDDVLDKQYGSAIRVAKELRKKQDEDAAKFKHLAVYELFGTYFDPITKDYKTVSVTLDDATLLKSNPQFGEGTTNLSKNTIRFGKVVAKINHGKSHPLDDYFRGKA